MVHTGLAHMTKRVVEYGEGRRDTEGFQSRNNTLTDSLSAGTWEALPLAFIIVTYESSRVVVGGVKNKAFLSGTIGNIRSGTKRPHLWHKAHTQ